jgi:hypothetical protein
VPKETHEFRRKRKDVIKATMYNLQNLTPLRCASNSTLRPEVSNGENRVVLAKARNDLAVQFRECAIVDFAAI